VAGKNFLGTLGNDLLSVVASHLNLEELMAISLTCKEFHKFVISGPGPQQDKLWLGIFQQEFMNTEYPDFVKDGGWYESFRRAFLTY
jgi:hypothetical protein